MIRLNHEPLERIGFYTLSDYRAKNTSDLSPLWRCELLLTDKCNFHCPYCRPVRHELRGHIPLDRAKEIMGWWNTERLLNIRFSGGEPTQYPELLQIIQYSKSCGIERIALSTNGSADLSYYVDLWGAGVNDFSISLDACCSSFGEKMNGGIRAIWDKTVSNIYELSRLTYVTVGCVFTEDNIHQANEIVEFAHSLGVADIRVISSSQYNRAIRKLHGLDGDILNVHPILAYRVRNFMEGRNVRGISPQDSRRCYLVIDDMAIAGDYHFPCIIYLREGGEPIGKVSSKMRQDRIKWSSQHDTYIDPICQKNCLDVCIDFNNKVERYQRGEWGDDSA